MKMEGLQIVAGEQTLGLKESARGWKTPLELSVSETLKRALEVDSEQGCHLGTTQLPPESANNWQKVPRRSDCNTVAPALQPSPSQCSAAAYKEASGR